MGANTATDQIPEARVVYQAHQDAQSRALLAGDWANFWTRIDLPHQLVTNGQTYTFETEEEGRVVFDRISAMLNGIGVTEVVRLVRNALYVTPDHIEGEHETHLLRGGQYVLPPYPNRVTLRRVDGVWRETLTNSAFTVKHGPFVLPEVDQTPRVPDAAND